MFSNRCLFAVAAVLLCNACSTSYPPARSPYIKTVMEGGTPTFVKDGQNYGGFLFGSGLVDATQGNPRAQHQAQLGRNLMIGGFVVDMAGLGSGVAGIAELNANRNGDQGVGVGLAIGGLGAVLVGTILLLNAQPHLYDAVNIYNDGVEGHPPAPPPAP